MRTTKAEFRAALKVILPLFDGDEAKMFSVIDTNTKGANAHTDAGRLASAKRIAKAAPMLAAAKSALLEVGFTSSPDAYDFTDVIADQEVVDGDGRYYPMVHVGSTKFRVGGGDGYHRSYDESSKGALTADQLRVELAKLPRP